MSGKTGGLAVSSAISIDCGGVDVSDTVPTVAADVGVPSGGWAASPGASVEKLRPRDVFQRTSAICQLYLVHFG